MLWFLRAWNKHQRDTLPEVIFNFLPKFVALFTPGIANTVIVICTNDAAAAADAATAAEAAAETTAAVKSALH